MPALRTLIFATLFLGTVAVLVPYLLLAATGGPHVDRGSLGILGLLLLFLGGGIALWCAWEFAFTGKGTPAPFDPPRVLVARGLYRYVRNPMYVGVLLLLLGEAARFRSLALLLYAALVFVALHLLVVLYEEPTLRQQFGEPYERYRQRVPRWMPRLWGRQRGRSPTV